MAGRAGVSLLRHRVVLIAPPPPTLRGPAGRDTQMTPPAYG
ncbi:hypothetical protein [Streptomyces sp. NPDC096030]